jgi:hypothetical protein
MNRETIINLQNEATRRIRMALMGQPPRLEDLLVIGQLLALKRELKQVLDQ